MFEFNTIYIMHFLNQLIVAIVMMILFVNRNTRVRGMVYWVANVFLNSLSQFMNIQSMRMDSLSLLVLSYILISAGSILFYMGFRVFLEKKKKWNIIVSYSLILFSFMIFSNWLGIRLLRYLFNFHCLVIGILYLRIFWEGINHSPWISQIFKILFFEYCIMYIIYITNSIILSLNIQHLFVDGLWAFAILLLTVVNYTIILLINNDLLHSHISQRLKNEEKLKEYKYLSEIDGLTGIYNRRTIEGLLNKEIVKAELSSNYFTVFLFDINSFKLINDTYGHNTGDSVLMYFSQLMQEKLRRVDSIGRWGGDEFLVISKTIDCQVAKQILDRILQMVIEMDQKQFTNHMDIRFTVSGGFGVYKSGDSSSSLINRADEMLYKNKNQKVVVSELL